jgi:hypothetical protein
MTQIVSPSLYTYTNNICLTLCVGLRYVMLYTSVCVNVCLCVCVCVYFTEYLPTLVKIQPHQQYYHFGFKVCLRLILLGHLLQLKCSKS